MRLTHIKAIHNIITGGIQTLTPDHIKQKNYAYPGKKINFNENFSKKLSKE